ncbi:hypothetical protein [Flavobacterium sp. GCM10023249]|uniref:hypothetical protein n=1 Tax=unclassified Flavobacterium TaxID=196869 RepID=UPI0036069D30
MNLFQRIFKKPTVVCPRCLGKGHVDLNDIQRLNKELYWLPGKCAYCSGNGKVHEDTVTTLPVDSSYLTISLSKMEQWKLIGGNQQAKKRGEIYQETLSEIIEDIVRQHYIEGLTLDAIADLHFSRFKLSRVTDQMKKDFLEYAEKVIAFHKDKYP